MKIVVQGLGFGDEGKGSIVDCLCRELLESRPTDGVVVRFNGGAQAAHHVILSDGREHCFSQWGSGTFRGVPTYLMRHVIVDPLAMVTEADHLIEMGVARPWNLLFADPRCLVTTEYHKNLNRMTEAVHQHGSTGMGIGATRRMWSETGDGVTLEDLFSDTRRLVRKLDWVRQWCNDKLHGDYQNKKHPSDFAMQSSASVANRLSESVGSLLIADEIPRRSQGKDIVIFEGAQGFGLDEIHGTVPHTTYSDTTNRLAWEIGQPDVILGVTRTYQTRHGNGPMFDEDSSIGHPDSERNTLHKYAGPLRSGHFHLNAINAAIRTCEVTHVALNHCDHCELPLVFQEAIDAPIVIKGHGPRAEDKKITRGQATRWENLFASAPGPLRREKPKRNVQARLSTLNPDCRWYDFGDVDFESAARLLCEKLRPIGPTNVYLRENVDPDFTYCFGMYSEVNWLRVPETKQVNNDGTE